MDRAKFFAALRAAKLFGRTLPQGAVDGTEHLLAVQEKYLPGMPLDELAYDLATAFHETAATMQPIKERGQKSYFDKYEPGTKIGKVLGNTQKGDGYRFRGEGHVQNTGRRNAGVATRRLNELFGLGIDLVKKPDLRGDPLISALSLFIGNREGWWTGKALGAFLDGIDEDDDADLREFIKARAVVNGTDKAEKIGREALVFEAALKLAGYVGANTVTAVSEQPMTDEATVEVVQRRLLELGYTEVGGIDGKIGKMTRAALLAFRDDNGLPLVAQIDRQLLVALDAAKPRELAPKREGASAVEVREIVPEAKTAWWNKILGPIVSVWGLAAASLGGALEFVGVAKETIEPIREYLPAGMLVIAVVGVAIFLNARKGEAKSIEAFQTGARR